MASVEIPRRVRDRVLRTTRSSLDLVHGELSFKKGLLGRTGRTDIETTVRGMWSVYSRFGKRHRTQTDPYTCPCANTRSGPGTCTLTNSNTSVFNVWRYSRHEGLRYKVNSSFIVVRGGFPALFKLRGSSWIRLR